MEQLKNGLLRGDLKPCYYRKGGSNYALIRVEKNLDFEYLFCQRLYNRKSIEQREPFGYAGIYCRRDNLVYDARYVIIQTEEEEESLKERTAESLREQLKKAVQEKVEETVGNDKSNLHVTNITKEGLMEQVEDLHQYKAKGEVRWRYLGTKEWQFPVYQCDYNPEPWSEDSLFDYILEPEAYVQREVENYLANNQEEMLYTFLENEAIEKEYQALMADKENPLHAIKRIKAAIEQSDAKMVNVTIYKNGVKFTFKTRTDDLRRDCEKYYSAYNIVAPDRRKFEEVFGRYANYTPKEIVCITYAKKELYRAEG